MRRKLKKQEIIDMSCKDCSTTGGCPFSFTQESEQIQNYGCLPTPHDIIVMRIDYGKTWACHENQTKPCLGAINFLNEHNLESKIIDSELVTEQSNWSDYIVPKTDISKLLSSQKEQIWQDQSL
jgi:hypothetical protein